MSKYRIVRNSVKCLRCRQEIESAHRHDFRYCRCGSVAVDGGKDYLKRCGSWEDYEETSITEWMEGDEDSATDKLTEEAQKLGMYDPDDYTNDY